MKKIIINERQEKLLGINPINEAANDNFSLEELSSINSFRGRLNYCQTMLGEHIGKGSSRAVFQIDDEKVLKLAVNPKGIAQNEAEYDPGVESTYGMIPKLFNCDDEYRWIIAEFVLPCKAADFKHCVGVPFKTYQNFVMKTWSHYAQQGRWANRYMSDEEHKFLVENNNFFRDLYYYMADLQLPYGDLLKLTNLGMTMRNGDPTIVILDSGLNDDVYNNYYDRR